MSVQLKICPFCGGKPKLYSYSDDPKCDRHWVGCYSKSCGKNFNTGLETGYFRTRKAAAEAWNKRVKPQGE